MTALTFSVEVITLPVSDVDRALRFYKDQLGFHLDVDYSPNDAFRVVQLTPPGSACSIRTHRRLRGFTPQPFADPSISWSTTSMPRNQLLGRGIAVGATRHKTPIGAWDGGFAPGLDPARGDYASFSDPDGNSWVLQERGYRSV